MTFASAHETAKTLETEFDLESEMTAMFTKQFKKILKKKKLNFRDPVSKDKNNEKPKTFPPKLAQKTEKKIVKGQEVKCYECQGFGHIALECPSKKNQKKVYTVTWDDESGSEQEPEEPESGEDKDSAFMAFGPLSHNLFRSQWNLLMDRICIMLPPLMGVIICIGRSE